MPQQTITAKQLSCYLDRLAGKPIDVIKTRTGLTENTINQYSSVVRQIINAQPGQLAEYRNYIIALVPSVIKRLTQLVPKAQVPDCIRILEGTTVLRKDLNIQHNIVHADLKELVDIVKQQANSEAQYQDITDVVEQIDTQAHDSVAHSVPVSRETLPTDAEGSTPVSTSFVPYISIPDGPVSPAPQQNSGISLIDEGSTVNCASEPPVENSERKKYKRGRRARRIVRKLNKSWRYK